MTKQDVKKGSGPRSSFKRKNRLGKKKKKINLAKTIKKREKEMAIEHWLELYYKRHESDDDNIEFTAAKIPSGAWGRVD